MVPCLRECVRKKIDGYCLHTQLKNNFKLLPGTDYIPDDIMGLIRKLLFYE